MNACVKELLPNILGGCVVALLTVLYLKVHNRLGRFHLTRVLGTALKPDAPLVIAYGKFVLPPLVVNGERITHFYRKQPRPGGAVSLVGTFSIENPVSESEVRASTYLARLFGQVKMKDVRLVSDSIAVQSNEGNFVALGGPGTNYKTTDILACTSNIFIEMEHEYFVLKSGERLPYEATPEHDYGFILRIRSPYFPSCSLIACAGLGEWSTSGATWFLSRKWMELMRLGDSWRTIWGFRRQPDFLAIVKIIKGQDDSASLVAYYRNRKGQPEKVL
ncbi:MAG: hypothetical protein ABSG80_16030 [Verrucomicrobiota bacterium]|jgi:hypothetical protein